MIEQHFLTHVFGKTEMTKEEIEFAISKFKKVTFDKNSFLLSYL